MLPRRRIEQHYPVSTIGLGFEAHLVLLEDSPHRHGHEVRDQVGVAQPPLVGGAGLAQRGQAGADDQTDGGGVALGRADQR